MKTQGGEIFVGETQALEVNLSHDGMATAQQPLVARCCSCNAESFFSAHQVAAAHRLWKLGSGLDADTANECLGGDGTTNHCRCGMLGEVVFTGETHSEAHWRRPQPASKA